MALVRFGADGLVPAEGAALLALRSGLALQPIGLAGTRRVLPRGSLLPTPGPVVLAVGEPISVAGLGTKDRAALTEQAREAVAALREEAAAAVASAGA